MENIDLDKLLIRLRQRGNDSHGNLGYGLVPCWELYKTQKGHFAVWDRNDKVDTFRAISLPYTKKEYAIKFLNENDINFHTYSKEVSWKMEAENEKRI